MIMRLLTWKVTWNFASVTGDIETHTAQTMTSKYAGRDLPTLYMEQHYSAAMHAISTCHILHKVLLVIANGSLLTLVQNSLLGENSAHLITLQHLTLFQCFHGIPVADSASVSSMHCCSKSIWRLQPIKTHLHQSGFDPISASTIT